MVNEMNKRTAEKIRVFDLRIFLNRYQFELICLTIHATISATSCHTASPNQMDYAVPRVSSSLSRDATIFSPPASASKAAE
jgi:hypothetical protein